MKRFRIIETAQATAYWVYEVEAETEEEALEFYNDTDPIDHTIDIDYETIDVDITEI